MKIVTLTAILLIQNAYASAGQITSPLPWQIYDSWFTPEIDIAIEPPANIRQIKILRSWPGGSTEVLHQTIENPTGCNLFGIDITDLPCGQYRIEVSTEDEHLDSGPFMIISDIPQIRVTRPDHQSIAGRGDRTLIKWDVLERVPWYTTDFTICVHNPHGMLIGCDQMIQLLSPREAVWEIPLFTTPGYYSVTVGALSNQANYGKGQILIDTWNTPQVRIKLRRYNEQVSILDVISRNDAAFRFLDLECSSDLQNWQPAGVVSPGSWFVDNDEAVKFFRLKQH